MLARASASILVTVRHKDALRPRDGTSWWWSCTCGGGRRFDDGVTWAECIQGAGSPGLPRCEAAVAVVKSGQSRRGGVMGGKVTFSCGSKRSRQSCGGCPVRCTSFVCLPRAHPPYVHVRCHSILACGAGTAECRAHDRAPAAERETSAAPTPRRCESRAARACSSVVAWSHDRRPGARLDLLGPRGLAVVGGGVTALGVVCCSSSPRIVAGSRRDARRVRGRRLGDRVGAASGCAGATARC